LPCSSAWSPRATGSDRDTTGAPAMLYMTAILTVAALVYLGYAMIRPERF
jgi:K+-transporting ATPase KdpF subunit